jgi:hypothetical protein
MEKRKSRNEADRAPEMLRSLESGTEWKSMQSAPSGDCGFEANIKRCCYFHFVQSRPE